MFTHYFANNLISIVICIVIYGSELFLFWWLQFRAMLIDVQKIHFPQVHLVRDGRYTQKLL